MKAERLAYSEPEAGGYLRYTEFRRSPLQRNRLSCLVDSLELFYPEPARVRILEVGCGTGNVCLPLAGLGYRVRAIDIDPASIEAAEEKNIFPNLTLAVRPMEEEDISAFDVVILTEVLEHIPDADRFFTDLAGRLSPGALLLLTVPNGWGISELFFRPAYRLKKQGRGFALIRRVRRILGARELTTANPDTPHLHFFTRDRLAALFRNNRLRLLRFYRIFFLWTLFESLFSARRLPESWARRDFSLSQRLPEVLSSTWIFLLRKEGTGEAGAAPGRL